MMSNKLFRCPVLMDDIRGPKGKFMVRCGTSSTLEKEGTYTRLELVPLGDRGVYSRNMTTPRRFLAVEVEGLEELADLASCLRQVADSLEKQLEYPIPALNREYGDTRIPFGPDKGRTLREISPDDLLSLRGWLEEKGLHLDRFKWLYDDIGNYLKTLDL